MDNFDHPSFLYGANSEFIEALYARYLRDPASVDPSWRRFFAELGDDASTVRADARGASWSPRRAEEEPESDLLPSAAPAERRPGGDAFISAVQIRKATTDSIRLLMLIRAYRVRGHLLANLDPLGLEGEKRHPELDPASYGFTDKDYDRTFFVDGVLGLETGSLREVLTILKQTYCANVGVEFMHIESPAQKSWIQERIERSGGQFEVSPEEKRRILNCLYEAEGFERFLQIKYPGNKRFSLEGAESMIAAIEAVIERGSDLGVEEIVIGMPHRGRLNVLTNVLGKSYAAVFSEFQGEPSNAEAVQGSGDVKYHLGASSMRTLANRKQLRLSLTPNPSHLEAVNPVVLGRTRAKQTMRGDADRERILAILLHGDAAFAGQGLVAETLGLSQLRGYKTGGTIHIIVNNQIGFTTSPKYSRSSPYPSDVGKMIMAPIFHVNGDNPEAVARVCRLAVEFRQDFKSDVVVDIFCYRRHGHNEGDEPLFTQPKMYKAIAKHPTTRQVYTEKLVAEGVLAPRDADQLVKSFSDRLEAELTASKAYRPNKANWLEGEWEGIEAAPEEYQRGGTAVPLETLREVGLKIAAVPDKFNLHAKILRVQEGRRNMIESGAGIDWAMGEALAFGTLLAEGHPVRLSGQDSCRGTFSHRHAVLMDQVTENRFVPLANLSPGQARLEVIDSMLSEAAVLGFEYGYSLTSPKALVLWEAQFGDFANGAQVIIDQFVTAGESKWLRMSGLVLLLPHGFEGQGPEHSSARLERFLQLHGEDNFQVVNCTTPSNYFHALRRQLKRTIRKPLVVMTPKSLLRHKMAVSPLAAMGPGTSFHRVLYEDVAPAPDEKIKRVVLCSGKVHYDLVAARDERGIKNVTMLRLEQLAPFPEKALREQLTRFPKAEVVWCQEEPKNMGAWTFVEPRIEKLLEDAKAKCRRPVYVGRKEAASPATGFLKVHQREQDALVVEAITV
ncbi:MAG: 2-oxoglutarate dehydrogenase E1 component [Alphaproteobacteria bacterium]|nr:2-oxoglutarate dehydrogenase E1 component [Alphaproteobacteria bacterium]